MKLEIKDGVVKLDGRRLERVVSIDLLDIGQNGPMVAAITKDIEMPDINPGDCTEAVITVTVDQVSVEHETSDFTKRLYGMN